MIVLKKFPLISGWPDTVGNALITLPLDWRLSHGQRVELPTANDHLRPLSSLIHSGSLQHQNLLPQYQSQHYPVDLQSLG